MSLLPMNDPMGGGFQGLLNNPMFQMGLGILGNNQGNYGSTGAALGRGMSQGLQQVQASKQFDMQNKLYQMKLKEYERDAKEREDKQKALPRLLNPEESYTTIQDVPFTSLQNVPISSTPDAVAPNFGLQRQETTTINQVPTFNEQQYTQDLVASGYGDAILKAQLEKKFGKQEPIKLGAGDILLDPTTRQPIYTAPADPQKDPDKVRQYKYAKESGFNGEFEDFLRIPQDAMMPYYMGQLGVQQANSDNAATNTFYNTGSGRAAPKKPTSSAAGVTVNVGGKTYSFPNQKAANNFKMKAGVR
jgi:hypothetical protein